jgi:hypothetical protein
MTEPNRAAVRVRSEPTENELRERLKMLNPQQDAVAIMDAFRTLRKERDWLIKKNEEIQRWADGRIAELREELKP